MGGSGDVGVVGIFAGKPTAEVNEIPWGARVSN